MPSAGRNIKDPVRRDIERRREELRRAKKRLEALAADRKRLKRRVFFVPGWRDESNVCWTKPYARGYTPLAGCFADYVANPEFATFLTFSDAESRRCSSFLDFGAILRGKILKHIGPGERFDIAGHSMGGLDAAAALTHPSQPLKGAHTLITVGTPHQGSELGEIGAKLLRMPKHHKLQGINLDPDQLPVQLLNRLKTRRKLLRSVRRFYCLYGTQDMAVMRSARYNTEGLAKSHRDKIRAIRIDGARHSQLCGITQDPRTVWEVLSILLATSDRRQATRRA